MIVSAIVPAWNEEMTLASVLDRLLECGAVDEVVCVDDGSTDGTGRILAACGPCVTAVRLPVNGGKGAALAAGIAAARGEIVAFFDADLTGLSDDHVRALLRPLAEPGMPPRVVLGRFANDNRYAHLVSAATGTRFTGVRAYHRGDLLPHLQRMSASRFGVEVYLNEQFDTAVSCVVPLVGLGSVGKHDKHPPAVAVRGYVTAAKEIAREVVRLRFGSSAGL